MSDLSPISVLEQAVLDLASKPGSNPEFNPGFNLVLNPQQKFENFKSFLKTLNLIPTPYPVILIAGTNGKGSVAHGLSHFLTKAGYNTGLFTSPHLFNFNERICVNNQPVDDQELLKILEKLKNKLMPPLCPLASPSGLSLPPGERREQPGYLNYFQISFLLALEYFKNYKKINKKLDIGIFEIGIGGRFDCVNTLDPILSLICSISKDHMEILGEDLASIANQKLGIARKNTALFYADKNPQEIIINNKIASQTEVYNRDFFYPEEFLKLKKMPKMAEENAALVLRALDYLTPKFPKLSNKNSEDILTISAPGRLVLKDKDNFKILIDVAHNEDSVRRLKKIIQENFNFPPLKIQAVFTAKPSKDIKMMLEILSDLIQTWHVTGLETEYVNQSPAQCPLVLEHLNLHHYASLDQAYQGALKSMEPQGLLVCFGSFSVASFVLRELEKT